MRSFIYLTFLPTLFISAFAGKKPDATSQNPEEGLGSPSRRPPHDLNPLVVDSSSLQMKRHGYKCQRTMYEMTEIQATIERACNLYKNNKKTGGVIRYPKISEEYEGGFKIVFPLTPNGKIYGSRYLAWGAPGNHFVRIDPKCKFAEVVYEARQKPEQASTHWCRLPNCFSRGGKTYNSCKLLFERPLAGPDYFFMPLSTKQD